MFGGRPGTTRRTWVLEPVSSCTARRRRVERAPLTRRHPCSAGEVQGHLRHLLMGTTPVRGTTRDHQDRDRLDDALAEAAGRRQHDRVTISLSGLEVRLLLPAADARRAGRRAHTARAPPQPGDRRDRDGEGPSSQPWTTGGCAGPRRRTALVFSSWLTERRSWTSRPHLQGGAGRRVVRRDVTSPAPAGTLGTRLRQRPVAAVLRGREHPTTMPSTSSSWTSSTTPRRPPTVGCWTTSSRASSSGSQRLLSGAMVSTCVWSSSTVARPRSCVCGTPSAGISSVRSTTSPSDGNRTFAGSPGAGAGTTRPSCRACTRGNRARARSPAEPRREGHRHGGRCAHWGSASAWPTASTWPAPSTTPVSRLWPSPGRRLTSTASAPGRP